MSMPPQPLPLPLPLPPLPSLSLSLTDSRHEVVCLPRLRALPMFSLICSCVSQQQKECGEKGVLCMKLFCILAASFFNMQLPLICCPVLHSGADWWPNAKFDWTLKRPTVEGDGEGGRGTHLCLLCCRWTLLLFRSKVIATLGKAGKGGGEEHQVASKS